MTIEENVLLGPLTTLGVGGPAKYMARISSEGELMEAVEFTRSQGLPVFVLGGGSNLLVGDAGFDGVVLRMEIAGSLEFVELDRSVEVVAAAGMDWDEFVLAICKRGLTGVECLAGIPGLVGGTPVQNVGAYGQEVAETIVSVRALDLETMQFVSLSAAECGFAYRKSVFNSTGRDGGRGRYVVTAVTFRFDPGRGVALRYAELQRRFEGQSPTPMEVYHAVREIRHGKGMLLVPGEADCRSAGSFFKNPVVEIRVYDAIAGAVGNPPMAKSEPWVGHPVSYPVPHWDAGEGNVKLAAAWLVEQAGFHKGFAMGRAGISSRHTLAVVNLGGASAGEIVALRDEILRRVEERFGVRLEQEPVLV